MKGTKFSGFPEDLAKVLGDLQGQDPRNISAQDQIKVRNLCADPALELISQFAPYAASYDPPHLATARAGKSLRSPEMDNNNQYHFAGRPIVHIVFWAEDGFDVSPGLHLVFAAGGFGLGAGIGKFDEGALQRYRLAVSDPSCLSALHNALDVAKSGGCHLEKSMRKELPAGFSPDDPAGEFLRHEGLLVRNRNEPFDKAIFGGNCLEYLDKRLQLLLPLQRWLMDHVFQPL